MTNPLVWQQSVDMIHTEQTTYHHISSLQQDYRFVTPSFRFLSTSQPICYSTHPLHSQVTSPLSYYQLHFATITRVMAIPLFQLILDLLTQSLHSHIVPNLQELWHF